MCLQGYFKTVQKSIYLGLPSPIYSSCSVPVYSLLPTALLTFAQDRSVTNSLYELLSNNDSYYIFQAVLLMIFFKEKKRKPTFLSSLLKKRSQRGVKRQIIQKMEHCIFFSHFTDIFYHFYQSPEDRVVHTYLILDLQHSGCFTSLFHLQRKQVLKNTCNFLHARSQCTILARSKCSFQKIYSRSLRRKVLSFFKQNPVFLYYSLYSERVCDPVETVIYIHGQKYCLIFYFKSSTLKSTFKSILKVFGLCI